jgi:hypothetical protein
MRLRNGLNIQLAKNLNLFCDRLWDHPFQDNFEGDRMAAAAATGKKVAVALPDTILEVNGVGIIITIKRHRERFKVDSVAFFSITLGLRDLTDQSIIHF